MTDELTDAGVVPTRYEVREFNGALRYSGTDESVARTIFEKYAQIGTPVILTAGTVVAESAAFTEQRAKLVGVVPWAQP